MSKIRSELRGLTGPFTSIARAMSQNWNVSIVPSGSRCCTDGDTIYIPYTADYLPEEKRKALNGNLDHEVCHVAEEREHKNAGKATPLALMRGERNRTIQMLFNVFEDIRIESKYAGKFPGVAENLDAANRDSVDLFRKRHGIDGDATSRHFNFWHTFGCVMILKARGYDASWAPAEVLPYMERVAREVEASNYPTTEWAEDALALAKAVYEKCRDKAEEIKREAEEARKRAEEEAKRAEEEAEGSDEDEGDTEGDPSEGDNAESGEGSDGAGEGDDDSDDDAEGTGGAGEGDDDEDSDDDATGEGDASADGDEGEPGKGSADKPSKAEEDMADDVLNDESKAKDVMDALKDEMESEVARDAVANSRYIPNPYYAKHDRWVDMGDAGRNPHLRANYDKACDDVAKQISGLKGKQLAVIQTMTRRRIRGDLDRGHLDGPALSGVRFGEKRVYCDTTKAQDLDTAILVLVDLSGSMGDGDRKGNAAYYAKRTTIALTEAWTALSVPHEVMGFTNSWDGREGGEPRQKGTVSRHPFDYYLFKGFNERLGAVKGRFANIRGYADNADSEAVLTAAKRLAARPEKRKILVVISDGEPACGGVARDMARDHLRDVVRMITKAGIEVLGIGAGTDAPKNYYNKSTGAENIVIKELDKMAATIFVKMRDMLSKSLKRAA